MVPHIWMQFSVIPRSLFWLEYYSSVEDAVRVVPSTQPNPLLISCFRVVTPFGIDELSSESVSCRSSFFHLQKNEYMAKIKLTLLFSGLQTMSYSNLFQNSLLI